MHIPVFLPLWRYHNLRRRPTGKKFDYPELESLINFFPFQVRVSQKKHMMTRTE